VVQGSAGRIIKIVVALLGGGAALFFLGAIGIAWLYLVLIRDTGGGDQVDEGRGKQASDVTQGLSRRDNEDAPSDRI